MYEWMKKIHMYTGLVSFMAFVVWGVTGVHAVFLPGPGGYQPPQVAAEEEFPFEGPGDLDDKQSPISQFVRNNRVRVLKPESGNAPNVFYVGLDKDVI